MMINDQGGIVNLRRYWDEDETAQNKERAKKDMQLLISQDFLAEVSRV